MKCLTTLKLRFLLRKEHHLHISQLVDCERISKTGLTLISEETPTIKKKKGHKILGNPIEKWAKSLKRKLIEEETLMANKYMKRYSTSLVITEKQIEPTMIYHFTPIRSAKITKLDNIKCQGEVSTKQLFQVAISQYSVQLTLHLPNSSPCLGICPRETLPQNHKDTCIRTFTVVFSVTAKTSMSLFFFTRSMHCDLCIR